VCVYFVLSLVLLRTLRRGRPGWRLSWALGALGLVMAIAFLDELHQYYVPGRGSSIRDVILDTAAAALGQVFAWQRVRRQPRLPESSSTAEPAS
jgi:VanZ family protein